MTSPFPMKDRVLISIGYAVPIVIGYSFSMFSPWQLMMIVFASGYYYVFRKRSRFICHHLKHNVNIIVSIILYALLPLTAFHGIVYGASHFGAELEGNMMAGFSILLSALSTLIPLLIIDYVLNALLIIAIIQTFIGKWSRFPLLIRVLK